MVWESYYHRFFENSQPSTNHMTFILVTTTLSLSFVKAQARASETLSSWWLGVSVFRTKLSGWILREDNIVVIVLKARVASDPSSAMVIKDVAELEIMLESPEFPIGVCCGCDWLPDPQSQKAHESLNYPFILSTTHVDWTKTRTLWSSQELQWSTTLSWLRRLWSSKFLIFWVLVSKGIIHCSFGARIAWPFACCWKIPHSHLPRWKSLERIWVRVANGLVEYMGEKPGQPRSLPEMPIIYMTMFFCKSGTIVP